VLKPTASRVTSAKPIQSAAWPVRTAGMPTSSISTMSMPSMNQPSWVCR
jgi:hypothetical protein